MLVERKTKVLSLYKDCLLPYCLTSHIITLPMTRILENVFPNLGAELKLSIQSRVTQWEIIPLQQTALLRHSQLKKW